MTERARVSLLPAGGALTRWLREQPDPDRAAYGTVALYRWRGWWFDRAWSLQRATLGARAAQLAPPIWVLGFWRSGTTLLHELLASHPALAFPQTWQCFNPGALLRRPPRDGTSMPRPMDGLPVSARSPQEDEFALLALGHESTYRAFLRPGEPGLVRTAFDGAHWEHDPEWANDLRLFLAGCTERGTVLTVKSPGHLFRLDGLRRWFPGSRMVWVDRDPLDVWHSNRKLWSAMAARYALWHWRADALDAFIAEALERYLALVNREKNATDIVRVRHEEVVARPLETVAGIADALRLPPWPTLERDVTRVLGRLRPASPSERLPLPNGAGLLVERLRAARSY